MNHTRWHSASYICVALIALTLGAADDGNGKKSTTHFPSLNPSGVCSITSIPMRETFNEQVDQLAQTTQQLALISAKTLSSAALLQWHPKPFKSPQIEVLSIKLMHSAALLSQNHRTLDNIIQMVDALREYQNTDKKRPMEQIEQEAAIVDKQLHTFIEGITHAHASSTYLKTWITYLRKSSSRGVRITPRTESWDKTLQAKRNTVQELGQNYGVISADVGALAALQRSTSCDF